MPDTTISAIDKSLAVLLQAERDFPGYSLDFCSGYVSTDGVLLTSYFTTCTIIVSTMLLYLTKMEGHTLGFRASRDVPKLDIYSLEYAHSTILRTFIYMLLWQFDGIHFTVWLKIRYEFAKRPRYPARHGYIYS